MLLTQDCPINLHQDVALLRLQLRKQKKLKAS
jgi:hypothetical protein